MKTKALRKYDEWYKKTRENLKHNEDIYLRELPSNYKYMKYWAEKLRSDEPDKYAKIEKSYMKIIGNTGKRLHKGYFNYLKEADKHKKGTKVRLTELARYVYYYSQDVYPCLIEAGMEETTKRLMQSFWTKYNKEILDHKRLLKDFQIDWILRFARQSAGVGIALDNDQMSTLQEMVKPPDPVILLQCKNQLQKANESLEQEDTLNALILADQALELFLRDLCIRFGCDENSENPKGDKFIKWGFSDYLKYLRKNGEIGNVELSDFFRFHDWRNGAQHFNLEPSTRSARMVIDKVTEFLNERAY